MTVSSGSRVAPIAFALAACSPTLDWRDVRVDGGALTALFPCRPDRQARAVPVAGSTVRIEMVACAAGGDTFAISFFDVAGPAAVGPALEALRLAMVANIRAGAPSAAPYAPHGATPNPFAGRVEAAGQRPDGSSIRAHAAFFARGLRVYQASVIGAAPLPESVNGFLGGLKLAS